jgi:transcriptional regulator with XRE-family HTH domain
VAKSKENFFEEIVNRHGIQLAELARRVGVERQHLTGFAKKRHGVSDEVLVKLAAILKVRTEDIIPGRTTEQTTEGKKYLMKALKMTDQYYAEDHFSEELLLDIATELHEFLIAFDLEENKNDLAAMKKYLHRRFCNGLAAKCFLDFIDKTKLDKK